MIPCPPFELDVNGTPGFNRDFPFVHRALRLPGARREAYAEEGSAGRAICTCVDADDVFFDFKRRRIYVSCGEGAVDVFQSDEAGTRQLARVNTSSGARTSLFVPELDRLFVAARADRFGSQASILVLRPVP